MCLTALSQYFLNCGRLVRSRVANCVGCTVPASLAMIVGWPGATLSASGNTSHTILKRSSSCPMLKRVSLGRKTHRFFLPVSFTIVGENWFVAALRLLLGRRVRRKRGRAARGGRDGRERRHRRRRRRRGGLLLLVLAVGHLLETSGSGRFFHTTLRAD